LSKSRSNAPARRGCHAKGPGVFTDIPLVLMAGIDLYARGWTRWRDMAEDAPRHRKREDDESQLDVHAGEAERKKARNLERKDYESSLRKLHVKLVELQEWVRHEGKKVCIVFEGRDGAGKGGTIKAITARVSPRIFRVVALPAPTEREKSQMYIQRYLPHLPAGGEVVIFDRSWYNRAGVERVMGFCSDEEAIRFLSVAPQVEKAMV